MFEVYKYSLSFKKPLVTASATFEQRKGLILRYHDQEIDVISEAAPLPGFSPDTLHEVLVALKEKQSGINTFLTGRYKIDDLKSYLSSLPDLPSLQFAVSTLGVLVMARRKNESLPDLLGKLLQDQLRVNAIVGSLTADELTEKVTAFYRAGFRTIKCKVTDEPGHLPQTLQKLSNTFSDMQFRLDPNRSWPASDILRLSKYFEDLPVEYIEEPCEISEPSQFSELSQHSIYPLAADESVARVGLEALLNTEDTPRFIIIKPMMLGNIFDWIGTISAHSVHDIRLIFTTSLESVVGRRIVSLLAGMFGSTQYAHGLNTGPLFSGEFSAENKIINGLYIFDERPDYFLKFKNIESLVTEKLI